MIQNEKPRVIVKNKTLQFIFDYCLESKTPFQATPRLNGDEWEIEFKVSDIMGGVALGMFLRENRIEPVGIQIVKPQTVAVSAKAKTTKAKKQEPEITESVFEQDTADAELTFESNQNAVEEPVTTPVSIVAEETAVESGGFSPEMLFDEN